MEEVKFIRCPECAGRMPWMADREMPVILICDQCFRTYETLNR